MNNLNSFHGQGNLVADPKVFGDEGNVVRFTVAINNGFGERRSTLFLDCVGFGKQAQTIAKYFKKGKEIIVSGYLDTDTWEDKEGNKRSKIELKLSPFGGFNFTSGGGASQGQEAVAASAPAETPPDNNLF